MTSLTDVYEGNVGRVASRRQKLLGTGLFLAGGAMVVGAIGLATTNAGVQALGRYPARELAGLLAGLGLPAVLLGVFAVLPASRSVRAAALIGSAIATVGVILFQYAYPYDWIAGAPLLALGTTAVYFLGVVTVFWCLFVALATFKTRNDPGGTARMEITREGTIRLVEEARSLGRFGGIGMFGTDLDGEVETQTNRETETTGHDGATVTSRTAVGDGGATETGMTAPGEGSGGIDEPSVQSDAGAPAGPGSPDRPGAGSDHGTDRSTDGGTIVHGEPDTAGQADGGVGFSNDFLRSAQGDDPEGYCGDCRHFEYVLDEDDEEPVPYCNFHDRTMDDLEPCSNWLER